MITANIISKTDLSLQDVFEISNYTIERGIDYNGKLTCEAFRKPKVFEGDYIAYKDGANIIDIGICDTVDNTDGNSLHTINSLELTNLFDQDVILKNEDMISSIGIEDFIRQCILDNYTNNEDPFLRLSYVEPVALTHTKVLSKVDAKDEILNLKTYLSNALEYYGIFLLFKFIDKKLRVDIVKRDQSLLQINADVTDICNYTETYKIDALAKLTVIWKIPDKEENDNTVIGARTIKQYFLLVDQTISEDVNNIDRAKGKNEIIYLEKETLEEINEEVQNKFKGNAYEHSVEAGINMASKIYSIAELYVGHECILKTRSHGIQRSIITKASIGSNTNFISLKFGNMKVTLIEKLREERKKW